MTDQLRSRERYRIGPLTLDADAFRLEEDGGEIPMPKLSLDLFTALVRRAPDVVTTDELMDVVWPKVVIAEETVSQRVRLVRDALGPEHRDIVATVRGRGYRLTVPVERLEDTPSAARAADDSRTRRRYLLLGAGVAVAIAAAATFMLTRQVDQQPEDYVVAQPGAPVERSIAVMPFVNMSADAGNNYFSDGVADEILSRLARVSDLRVTSRISSFALKERGLDIQAIAERLAVRYILDGSVRKSGNRVRVTAKLIDVESDAYVLTRSFERELVDIFAVQDEIAGAVVATLAGTLDPSEEATALESSRLTHDLEAYELYLEAKYYLQLRGLEAVTKSIALLEQAVERDPQFADAHAVLASAYITMPFYTNEPTNRYPALMESSARTALRLDEQIGLAEGVLAAVEGLYKWNWAGAEAHFDRALVVEPNNSVVWQWYAEFLLRVGRFEDARTAAREGVRLDPVGSSVVNVLGLIHHYLGEDDKALDYAARAREFGQLGGYLRAMVYLGRGQYEQATAAWEDAAPQMGLDMDWIHPYIEAIRDPTLVEAALEAIARARADGHRTPSGFVSEYVALNQLDLAFELIDEEIDRQLLYIPILWEPGNRTLRQDPRFAELLVRLRIVDYWQQQGWPDQCKPAQNAAICD